MAESKTKEDILLERYGKLAEKAKSQDARIAELESELAGVRDAREAKEIEAALPESGEGKSEPDHEREDAVTRWAERQMKKEAEDEKRRAERSKVRRPDEIEEQSADVLSRMLHDVQGE